MEQFLGKFLTSLDSYISKKKLYSQLDRLYLGLFLAAIEISIVGTVLVAITNDLGEFGQSTWAITAYLLTYTGKSYLAFAHLLHG